MINKQYPEYKRKWKVANKETYVAAARRGHLRRKYGITQEQYEALVEKQKGLCAICSQTCSTSRFLSVDHDHKTGKVRGLLCRNCNGGIGKLKDSEELLLKAVEYLREAS